MFHKIKYFDRQPLYFLEKHCGVLRNITYAAATKVTVETKESPESLSAATATEAIFLSMNEETRCSNSNQNKHNVQGDT